MSLLFVGRRDILGAAETGSGKTLAFGLPILVGILNLKNKNEEQSKSSEFKQNISSEKGTL